MPIEVVLPKVDMDMEAGVIAAWKVAEGAFVRTGDVLFEMETDKSMMEVESPGTGIIRGLVGITGEPIPVGTPVAWIDSEDASDPAPASARPAHDIPEVVSATNAPASNAAAVSSADATSDSASSASLRATPSARRIARLRDVDLAAVTGSGPRGRIQAGDVEAFAGAGAPVDTAAAETGELVPFNSIRRLIAQRLSESARNAPHFYLTAQVEMTALRDAMQRPGPPLIESSGMKLSITLLLAHIAGRVLANHPRVNASVEGDAVRLHRHVNIGIAMDRDGDLFVPVLRNVDARTLADLAREFARLRQAVQSGTIMPSDLRGGTFTISNLGMYGVDAFTAIINPPESAILAIGQSVDTPVGRDGQVVLRPMATLSLSSDHRVIDGIVAARFMADLRRAIEHPEGML